MNQVIDEQMIAKMDNAKLAKQLRAYWIAAPMYNLPKYLVMLLNETATRLTDIGTQFDHEDEQRGHA